MTFTYDPVLDRMTIQGEGTPTSPIAAIDIYNADKAGVLANHTRTGIAGTDASPVAVDIALLPQDYLVLGGAAQDLWILIENWSGPSSATIRIAGTDFFGSALTEDIVVTGNGTSYAVNQFKTVESTQVIAFSGSGSFDYKLEQGQWGRVYKSLDSVYFRFDSEIFFTDATSYFKDTLKRFEFKKLVWLYPCHMQLGDQANDRGYNGCQFIGNRSGEDEYFRNIGGSLKLYGCLVQDAKFEHWKRVEILNTHFQDCYHYFANMAAAEQAASKLKNMWWQNTSCRLNNVSWENAENIYIADYTSSINFYLTYCDAGTVVKNVTFINNYKDLRTLASEVDLIDVVFDKTKVLKYSASPHILHAKYSLNLRLTEKLNNPVVGASVKAYKNGDYSDLTPNGGATPVIDTTTDGNGDIPEQIVESFKLDELVETAYYPFLFILDHGSYPTKKFKIDITEKSNWVYAYGLEEAASHDEILKAIKLNKALLFAT